MGKTKTTFSVANNITKPFDTDRIREEKEREKASKERVARRLSSMGINVKDLKAKKAISQYQT